jgi:hypothetical protein
MHASRIASPWVTSRTVLPFSCAASAEGDVRPARKLAELQLLQGLPCAAVRADEHVDVLLTQQLPQPCARLLSLQHAGRGEIHRVIGDPAEGRLVDIADGLAVPDHDQTHGCDPS